MILIFKLLIVTAFLVPITWIIFKLVIGLKLASEGRKESNSTKVKTGRTTAMNSFVALLLILAVAWFVFSEFITFEI